MSDIDWSSQKRPWVKGKNFKPLTNEQYAAAMLATGTSPKDARAHALAERAWEENLGNWSRAWENSKGAGGAGLETMADLGRLFGKAVEAPVVMMGRMGQYRVSQFLGDEYNSEAHKTFRYENAEQFKPLAAFVRGVKDSYMGGHALAAEHPETFGDGKLLGPGKFFLRSINPGDSFPAHLLRGAAYAKIQIDKGFPWAKSDPQAYRNELLDDINPMWLASPAMELYQGAKESAHVEAMLPTVKRMVSAIETSGTRAYHDFTLAANNLYMRDTVGPKLFEGVASQVKNGTPVETITKALYDLGHRAPGAGAFWKDLDLSKVPAFFKRGGEGASSNIRDFVYEAMKKGQKLSDYFRDEINAAGTVKDSVAKEVQYLLRTVPRNAPTSVTPAGEWDTSGVVSSFRNNYDQMVAGKKAMPVSEEALRYASETIKDTTLGYRSDVNWNPLLAPSKKFAAGAEIISEPSTDPLQRVWLNPAGVPAEDISGTRLALWRAKYKTHEQVVDEANGIFAHGERYKKALDGAIASGNERISKAKAIIAGLPGSPVADVNAVRDAGADVSAARAEYNAAKESAKTRIAMTPESLADASLQAEVSSIRESLGTRAQGTFQRLGEPVKGLTPQQARWPDDKLRAVVTGEIESPAVKIPELEMKALRREYVRRLAVADLKDTGDWDIARAMTPEHWAGHDGIEYSRILDERIGRVSPIHEAAGQVEAIAGVARGKFLRAQRELMTEVNTELGPIVARGKAAAGKLATASQKFDSALEARARLDVLGVHDLVAGGPDAMVKAEADLASLKNQRAGIDKVIKDFKSFTTTPDYLAELKKAEPVVVGRVIGAFDSAMSGIRGLQLFNPGTQLSNFFDTNGPKNLIFGNVASGEDIWHTIKNGQPAMRYGLAGEDLNEIFTTDVSRYAYDATPSSRVGNPIMRAYSAAKETAAEVNNAFENTGRATLGRKSYETIVTRLVDQGMDPLAASKIAITEAMRYVDKVHVDYANLSPFEKILRRGVSLYPRFNFNDAANYTEWAMNNGSEALGITQLRGHQQEGSLDGKGSEQFGSMIADPAANVSILRIPESAVMLGRALTGPEKVSLLPVKILQAAFGSSNPFFDSAAQAAGLAPEKNKGSLSKYDTLLANSLALMTDQKVNFALTDPVTKALGLHPQTSRDATWAMQTKWEQAKGIRQGKLIEEGDALRLAQFKTVGRTLVSLVAPFSGMVGTDDEDAKMMTLVRDGNRAIDAAPDEHKSYAKEALLAQPEYKGLRSFLKKTPDESYRAALQDATTGEVMSIAASELKNPASIDAKAERGLAAIGATAHNVAHLVAPGVFDAPPMPPSISTGTPGIPFGDEPYGYPVKRADGTDYPAVPDGQVAATDPGTGAMTTTAAPHAGVDFSERGLKDGSAAKIAAAPDLTARLDTFGNVTFQTGNVIDPRNILEYANQSSLLNVTLKTRLDRAVSDEELKGIIDSYGQTGQPALKMVRAAATVSGYWADVAEGYDAASTEGAAGNFRKPPAGLIGTTRAGLTQWFKNKINTAPAKDIEGMLNWTVPQAQAALRADVLAGRGPVGLDYSAVMRGDDAAILKTMTPTNLAMITSGFDAGSATQIIQRRMFAEDKAHEDNKTWRDRLTNAVRVNPAGVKSVVDAINSAIDAGDPKISSDFWETTARIAPGLYESAAHLDNYEHILRVRDNITRFDTQGKLGPTASISVPLVIAQLEKNPGDASVISFIRQNGLRDGSGARMEQAAAAWDQRLNTMPPEIADKLRINLDAIAPLDPSFAGEHAVHDFNLRTRVDKNVLYEKLSTWDPSQESVATAPVETANLTPSTTAPHPESSSSSGSAAPSAPAPMVSIAPPLRIPSYRSLQSSPMRTAGTAAAYTTEVPTSGVAARGIIPPAMPFGADRNGRIVNTGVTAWLKDGVAQSARTGIPLTTVLGETATTQNGSPSVDGYKAASALTNLAGMTNNLAMNMSPEYSNSDTGKTITSSITGIGAGLGMYAALAMFGPVGMIGIGASVVFGGLSGASAGGLFGGPKSNGAAQAESLAIQRERLALDRERFDEQLKQTSIRDLRTREQDLAAAITGGKGGNSRAPFEQHLAAFARRGTFASRIGLVDQAERSVNLKPAF